MDTDALGRNLAKHIQTAWERTERRREITLMHIALLVDEVSPQILEEFHEDEVDVLHVGYAIIAGTKWTYLMHAGGMDLVRLVVDENDEPRIERRFLGPLWRLDYREELTGSGADVVAFIDAPILDEPISLRRFPGTDLREARALLREWARRPRRPPFARAREPEHAAT